MELGSKVLCARSTLLGRIGCRDQQFLDPEDLNVVDALRNYKETSWTPVLPHGGLPERILVFPDFKDLDWIADNLE
jgi:hypothetical protein